MWGLDEKFYESDEELQKRWLSCLKDHNMVFTEEVFKRLCTTYAIFDTTLRLRHNRTLPSLERDCFNQVRRNLFLAAWCEKEQAKSKDEHKLMFLCYCTNWQLLKYIQSGCSEALVNDFIKDRLMNLSVESFELCVLECKK